MKKVIVLFIFSFLFTAFLTAQPQYYNLNNGTSSNSFPFNVAGGKAVNSLFLAGEFNQPTPIPMGQRITKVYFRTSTAGSRTYTNLHILMAQDTTTTLTTGQFYSGPMDTVFFSASENLSSTAGGWMGVTLNTPFPYNPAKSLILFVGHCGATGTAGSVYNTTLTGIRRVWSVGGCPFVPYASGDAAMLNFGVDVEPIAPDFYNYTTGVDNSFPLNQPAGKMVQWFVGPNEYNQPTPALGGGNITGLYLRVSSTYPLGPATYTTFNILLGQTSISGLTTGQFYSGVMDTVYRKSNLTLQAPVNTWLYFPLDVPFPYNPGLGLIIEVGQCGATGTTTGYSLPHTTIAGPNRRVWSVAGCPFVPYASAGTNVVNNGIDIEYPTGVSGNNHAPRSYILEQNYPNPFNPVTSISFAIPREGNIKLAVYDMLGREITVLVDESKKAGNYSVTFDASNFASGVYFYKITAGDFTETKKMTLIK